jgi:protein-L-isoaspartate(D-aspartate) O-methyltransferase
VVDAQQRTPPDPDAEAFYQSLRLLMVRSQLQARNIRSPGVLRTMAAVPRHEFVPADQRAHAYDDYPLPLGPEQTISQPYIVALMTQESGAGPGSRVLEIGTGSGYQAAVLADVGARVYTLEIDPDLAARAGATLARLDLLDRVTVRTGDGRGGWPEEAPFDAILVTAAPRHVPEQLQPQLAMNGRLIVPVGQEDQDLVLVEKTPAGFRSRSLASVRFVPMQEGRDA